jgi:hypothetical protein
MFRLFSALLIFKLLLACGTIIKREQILSLDSEPRGSAIYLQNKNEKQYLGNTPLFYKSTRSHSKQFQFELAPGIDQTLTVSCKLRWSEAVLPNSLLGFVGTTPAVGILAFAIDGYTGNLFYCPDFISMEFPDQKVAQESSGLCESYLIVPPHAIDAVLSDFIFEKWKNEFKKSIKPCDLIIYDDRSKELFSFLNIDYSTDLTFKDLKIDHLLYLGAETQATHLVFLNTLELEKKIVVSSAVYDIHRKSEEKDLKNTVMLAAPEYQKHLDSSSFLLKNFHLFPNAITASAHVGSSFTPIPYIHSIEEKNLFVLPKVLTAFSVDSIIHPDSIGVWGYNLTISPSLISNYSKTEYTLTNQLFTDEEPVKFTRDLIYILPLMNAGATIHTPIGAFGAAISAGFNFLYWKDSHLTAKNKYLPTYGVNIHYSAFFTKNLYFLLAAHVLISETGNLKNEFFETDSIITRASVGLGYFLPNIRRSLSSSFRNATN